MNQIYPAIWLSQPKETREHLIKVFNIERTGVTEIRDQDIVSDGYTVTDLQAITLEKMNEYIGSVETFSRAWELTLMKVRSELNPPVGEIKSAEAELYPVGSISSTDVEGIADVVDDTVKVVEEGKPPFCDTCDSKGVRHLKVCPKYIPIEHGN